METTLYRNDRTPVTEIVILTQHPNFCSVMSNPMCQRIPHRKLRDIKQTLAGLPSVLAQSNHDFFGPLGRTMFQLFIPKHSTSTKENSCSGR